MVNAEGARMSGDELIKAKLQPLATPEAVHFKLVSPSNLLGKTQMYCTGPEK